MAKVLSCIQLAGDMISIYNLFNIPSRCTELNLTFCFLWRVHRDLRGAGLLNCHGCWSWMGAGSGAGSSLRNQGTALECESRVDSTMVHTTLIHNMCVLELHTYTVLSNKSTKQKYKKYTKYKTTNIPRCQIKKHKQKNPTTFVHAQFCGLNKR